MSCHLDVLMENFICLMVLKKELKYVGKFALIKIDKKNTMTNFFDDAELLIDCQYFVKKNLNKTLVLLNHE